MFEFFVLYNCNDDFNFPEKTPIVKQNFHNNLFLTTERLFE